ncbi:MAG: stage V sporulation protein B [Bacillota bacterium]
MRKQSVLIGALILVVASLLNRMLGFGYQILVIRLLGPEGVGLYQMVFPIYSLILVITTAGIPVAVSKMVAEQAALQNWKAVYRIFYLALIFITVTGLIATLTVWYIVPTLVRVAFSDARVYWTLVVMVPAIFIVAICSVFRSFFQGLQQMVPTALGQVFETMIRVVVGIYFATRLAPYGLEYAAAGLAIGMVAGELAGLALILVYYIYGRPQLLPSGERLTGAAPLLRGMFNLAVPVTMTRIVTTLTLSIQALLVPQRLVQAGHSLRQATELYGQFTGIALTLLHLPTILTMSLATTLIPAISEAAVNNNKRLLQQRCSDALRLTILMGLPATVLFTLLPTELSAMIFNSPEAGIPLKVLAWGSVFLFLQQTTSGILLGLGRVSIGLFNSLIGSLINITGIYYLTALPGYGIQGAALALNLGAVVAALLNILTITRVTGISLNFFQLVVNPALASLAMGLVVRYYAGGMIPSVHQWPSIVNGIAAGLLAYVLVLLATGSITRSDLQRLPYIGKWAA